MAVVILCFIHARTKRRTLAVRFNNQKRGDIDMKRRERMAEKQKEFTTGFRSDKSYSKVWSIKQGGVQDGETESH